MEQAESKHCQKSELGLVHERHHWTDGGESYSCDGDILSASDVFGILGIRRVVDGDVPMYDSMPIATIIPNPNSIKRLFGSSDAPQRTGFDGFENDYLNPSHSSEDTVSNVRQMQRRLAEDADHAMDAMIGVRTEFASRTYGWSSEHLREALFEKEQEVIEMVIRLEKIEKSAKKLLKKIRKAYK